MSQNSGYLHGRSSCLKGESEEIIGGLRFIDESILPHNVCTSYKSLEADPRTDYITMSLYLRAGLNNWLVRREPIMSALLRVDDQES